MMMVLILLILLCFIHDSISFTPNMIKSNNYPSKSLDKSNNKLFPYPSSSSGKTKLYFSSKPSLKPKEDRDNNSEIDYKSDLIKTGAWVAAASGFAAAISYTMGSGPAVEFAAGYLLEESLSIDNLFVFLLLFDYFKVSRSAELKILEYGILGAVVLRGAFIWAGALAIENFHQIVVLFGVILFGASYKILFPGEDDGDDEDLSQNSVVLFAKKFLKSTDKFDRDQFFTVENGQRVATPLLLCLVCIELSDIIFAFDSVPAIYGVTNDPFIVYTSNVFAICSLRSLYGILSGAVSQLKYLEKAVGLILAVIGAKLTFAAFDIEILDPMQSLMVVLALLGSGVGLSVREIEREKKENEEIIIR